MVWVKSVIETGELSAEGKDRCAEAISVNAWRNVQGGEVVPGANSRVLWR